MAAFAGDTTYLWRTLGLPEKQEGVEAHAAFWKQMMLWLAHQEQGSGAVRVMPDVRRLSAGSKLDFSVGAFGKNGKGLTDARFEVTVENPRKVRTTVATTRKPGQTEERGTFVWTEEPGEYRLLVAGKGKDVDGAEIVGTAESRFLVYHDDTELARQAADHEFLRDLAAEGGGQLHQAAELDKFLQDLAKRLPLPAAATDRRLPNWSANDATGFLACFFLVFVALVCLEWFLRRSWGLV